jgi:hypothetical protein
VVGLNLLTFYEAIAMISPYDLLSQAPQTAERSILLSIPTNPLSGFISAIRRRQAFLATVALVGIVAEFLPLFLSNVPFRVTQTWEFYLIMSHGTEAILGLMIAVVIWSFLIKWPAMSVDPGTIAGATYYVHSSWMSERFQGLSILPKNQRDLRVKEMRARYEYGAYVGVDGGTATGIDIVASSSL